jgi:ribosomal protein S1
MVLNADKVRRRISLSLKQLQERPVGLPEQPAQDYSHYNYYSDEE